MRRDLPCKVASERLSICCHTAEWLRALRMPMRTPTTAIFEAGGTMCREGQVLAPSPSVSSHLNAVHRAISPPSHNHQASPHISIFSPSPLFPIPGPSTPKSPAFTLPKFFNKKLLLK